MKNTVYAQLIWAWSVWNIKVHIGRTLLFLENKCSINELMYPHTILAFFLLGKYVYIENLSA